MTISGEMASLIGLIIVVVSVIAAIYLSKQGLIYG